jgi:hypothetical protein
VNVNNGSKLLIRRIGFMPIWILLAGMAVTIITLAQSDVPFAVPTAPQKVLDNGSLHAEIYLPNAANGFYRGTRFDWSGVVGKLTYGGHNYYGPWFDDTDPKVGDWVYRDAKIVAGPCSAMTGPAEEFTVMGFDEAPAGGTFVKIGVGVLRKPDDAKYDHYRVYEIVQGAEWKIKTTGTSIEFEQQVLDKTSGLGYDYRKTIRLMPGAPQMAIEHSLQNTGTKDIQTRVYDHNFLVLDHQTTGPDFTIQVPFEIKPARPVDATVGNTVGGKISYIRPLEGGERFSVSMAGFSPNVSDYDFTIANSKVNAQVRVVGDQPLTSDSLFSTRSVVAVEPYINISVATGQQMQWKYVYTYGTAH